jgi:3D (Asp-Asp-Asp) domain-containing protein
METTDSLIVNLYPNIPHCLLVAVLVFLVAGESRATSEDPTLWTSADGVTIRARLAGWDGRRVFLVKNGRHFEVPLARLSASSVQKAKRLLEVSSETASATASERTKADKPLMVAQPAITHTVSGSNKSQPSICKMDRHGMSFHPMSSSTRVVRTTAYSCLESDHNVYGSFSALGTLLKYGGQVRSAAADWSVYPAGTTFRIAGLPWNYVIDDYGSALTGTGTIDIYHPTLEGMRKWGRRNVEITIISWGAFEKSARILAGRTQHSHCRTMLEAIRHRLRGDF